jgi:hypothetical protein
MVARVTATASAVRPPHLRLRKQLDFLSVRAHLLFAGVFGLPGERVGAPSPRYGVGATERGGQPGRCRKKKMPVA